MPRVRIATGCHPHNAKHYDDALEAVLRERLADPRTAAVGEIGLDFHYDFSPRDDQREAFRRQLRLAKEAGLPVAVPGIEFRVTAAAASPRRERCCTASTWIGTCSSHG